MELWQEDSLSGRVLRVGMGTKKPGIPRWDWGWAGPGTPTTCSQGEVWRGWGGGPRAELFGKPGDLGGLQAGHSCLGRWACPPAPGVHHVGWAEKGAGGRVGALVEGGMGHDLLFVMP